MGEAAVDRGVEAQPAVRVAVCVATYRRPVMLGRLLESLGAQRIGRREVEVRVHVVDNDAAESARAVVEGFREAGFPWPLRYEVEPDRNIALARNRGVRDALGEGADWVAFIDDDETADPAWLDELLEVAHRHGAEVVGGAIVPRFEEGTPDWVMRGGFFDEAALPTGSPLRMAYTGNALIAAARLPTEDPPFDPAFGRSGGEDSHFFLRLREGGATMVRANEAVTEEWVPVTKATAGWIVRRAFRVGAATTACERSVLPLHRGVLPRAAKGVVRLVEGLVRLPVGALAGPGPRVAALRKVAHGAGCLAGLFGLVYREYEGVHGV